MARWLKQSTSVDVPIGPFVSSTDGFTAQTGLTITQPDVRLKKNGAAWAQKAAAQTLSHEENGNYEVTLDATDTDTLGMLRLHVNETGALPVWEDFAVVPANVWDSLFGSDKLQVHADEITAGLITAAAIATGAIDADAIAADAITDAKVASDVTIASVTGAVGSVTGAVGSVTGAVGSIAAGGITAASFAANAINAAKLDPDVTTELQSGLATAAALAVVDGIVDDILVDTGTTLQAELDGIQADTEDIQSRLPAALSSGRINANVITDFNAAVATDGGNSATSFKTTLTQTEDDHWKDAYLRLTSGDLLGQVKKVSAYNGTTKFITVLGGFTGTPADATSFDLINE